MHGLDELLTSNETPHARIDEHFGATSHENDATEYRSFDTNLAAKHRRDRATAGVLADVLADLLIGAALEQAVKPRTLADRPRAHTRHLGMEGVHCAIDAEPPFLKFWQKLNAERAAKGFVEAVYREAKEAFTGGPTPVGALTFIGKEWDGLRAVPAEPVKYLGGKRPAYHGEHREVTGHGTIWHKVLNNDGHPISYGLPEAALVAAKEAKAAAIQAAFH